MRKYLILQAVAYKIALIREILDKEECENWQSLSVTELLAVRKHETYLKEIFLKLTVSVTGQMFQLSCIRKSQRTKNKMSLLSLEQQQPVQHN